MFCVELLSWRFNNYVIIHVKRNRARIQAHIQVASAFNACIIVSCHLLSYTKTISLLRIHCLFISENNLISYYGKFTITNQQYNDSLADESSVSYKGLSAEVKTQVCV